MLQNKGEGDLDTETQTGHREEVHVTTKIGVMQFTNKETPRIIRGHQKLGEGKEESPLTSRVTVTLLTP